MILENRNMPWKRFVAPEIIAAGIGAAGAIAGAGTSAAGQSSLNRATMEFNKEEAEKQRLWSEKMYNAQNTWNYEMWKAENEYNTPAEQKKRLIEAGLNPMFYGLDGNVSSNAEAAAQPLNYERASVGALENPYAAFGSVAKQVAEIANIQANTAKQNNETQTETARREKILAEIENTKQELNNLKAQEGLTQSQKEKLDKDVAWLDRLNEATIAEKEAKIKLDNSQQKRVEELLEGEKILQSKTIEDFDRKWQKISAEIKKMSKETGLLEKDIENYALNHANNGFMGTGLSIQNLIRSAIENAKNKKQQDAETQKQVADATAAIVDNKY